MIEESCEVPAIFTHFHSFLIFNIAITKLYSKNIIFSLSSVYAVDMAYQSWHSGKWIESWSKILGSNFGLPIKLPCDI